MLRRRSWKYNSKVLLVIVSDIFKGELFKDVWDIL